MKVNINGESRSILAVWYEDNQVKIGINDPTIKALEEIHGKLEPGRIIKIIRKSPTAGYYEYYRVIVKSVI